MTKIINLQLYRNIALEKRIFAPWKRRFGEIYGLKTRLSDLSDKVLYHLAQPGEPSSVAYYELIMGVLDFERAPNFHYLSNENKMKVVDIHLFLADQVRFEMMWRLEWIKAFEARKFGLIELVQNFKNIKTKCRENPPELAESNPDYHAYTKLTYGDKEVFIRRMLQKALEAFTERI
ncbi:MAG: hypothetical protein SRB2_00615 [Desulfobacteraceae bacterium Eth-SRB2]|nr:MAG: hypothetical protein SRB2_00615 [Desulfobacteraceae bacterium Eth-SRB2]